MVASRGALAPGEAIPHPACDRVEFGAGRPPPLGPDPEPVAGVPRDHVQVNVEDLLERRLPVGQAFRGLDLVEPGLVVVSEWRPQGAGPRPLPAEVAVVGGVARKP
jgi:hypothetical protein